MIKYFIFVFIFNSLIVNAQFYIEYVNVFDLEIKTKTNKNVLIYTTATWCVPCISKLHKIDSIISLKKDIKLIILFENFKTNTLNEKVYLSNLNVDTIFVLKTEDYPYRPKKNIKLFTKDIIKSKITLDKIENWILGEFILYRDNKQYYVSSTYGDRFFEELKSSIININ